MDSGLPITCLWWQNCKGSINSPDQQMVCEGGEAFNFSKG